MNHERTVWQFNYAKDQPTPWFYPLNLPDGTELVWLNPPDHPWHHALWFSWKDLNGLTYWEQGPGQGRVQVEEVKVTTQADFSAQIELTAGYHPEGKPTILTEKRLMTITAPDANGAYRIDWKGTFTAGTQDVHMKGGTAGGGYAGMSVRISNQSRDWQLLDSEGRQDVPGGGVTAHTHGQHSRWADFSLVSTRTGTTAGIALFDHPTNLRYPSFWHDIMDSRHTFGYFSPAPLWKEPYDLPAGKALSLRYRVLVHPGRPDPVQVEAEFKSFSETR